MDISQDYKFEVFTVPRVICELICTQRIDASSVVYRAHMKLKQSDVLKKSTVLSRYGIYTEDSSVCLDLLSKSSDVMDIELNVNIPRTCRAVHPYVEDGKMSTYLTPVSTQNDDIIFKGPVSIDVAVCYVEYADIIRVCNFMYIGSKYDEASYLRYVGDCVYPDWIEDDLKKNGITLNEADEFIRNM